MEYATRQDPAIATIEILNFASQALLAKAPRIKWESAKVISNIAYLFRGNLEQAINNLFQNTEHPGTVVRWSAATALSEIVKLKDDDEMLTALQAICHKEEKVSIKKIYSASIKKAGGHNRL